MGFDQRIEELGLAVPDFAAVPCTGLKYGAVESHHLVGDLLFPSGHMPERSDGSGPRGLWAQHTAGPVQRAPQDRGCRPQVVHPGALGRDLTIGQGHDAARVARLNALGGIRYTLGTLDRVVAVVRSLNFVVCTPDFHDIPLVADGVTDLLRDVFGEDAGVGGRATVGVVDDHRRSPRPDH
jgi:hypothetical protein